MTFQSERSVINLHLMHTSYFLFVMAMMLVCYALIKGKPKQKAILVDKVWLCSTIIHADFRYILC